MAKASERKSGIETTSSRIGQGVIPGVNGCIRCGGLLVQEFCLDFFNCTGELEAEARRCVQCGGVVDPVILRNRRQLPTHHESIRQGRTL